MLKITSVTGNIFHDKGFKSLKDGNFERLKVSRTDLEKSRIRRQTDRGTDIGLVMEPGSMLHHGDVLKDQEKTIVIEQIPEKVILVKAKNKTANLAELFVLIGHIIGNRHRPISISGDVISFPIQADSEFEVFQKLFADIINDVELTIGEEVFRPHLGANVHEH